MIYNYTIGYFYTRIITRKVLDLLPDNSHILDIGIGTGYVYATNSDIIKRKNLSIVGIDIDAEYISAARRLINSADLEQHIKLINNNVYNVESVESVGSVDMKLDSFDYVMFSDSYAVIPNVHDMITFCEKFLKPDENSKIIIVSTLFDKFNKYIDWIKSHIVYVSTVDYGSMMIKSNLEKYLIERNINGSCVTVIDDYMYLCKLMKSSTYMVTWAKPLISSRNNNDKSNDESKEVETEI